MPNATQLLRQDHKKVKALFDKFEKSKAADAKRRLALQSMNDLEVHARVEEEIFYPAVKKAIAARELVDEARKEHQEAKSLIRQLKKAGRQDDGEDGEGDFEAKFSELMQAIQHHVEEEEGEMFPQVEDSELDLSALGMQMAKRKQAITKAPRATKGKSATRSRSRGNAKSTRQKKPRSQATRSSARKRARAR
jgi:hemerythrin superfamily protein